jgi:hypothetical protein
MKAKTKRRSGQREPPLQALLKADVISPPAPHARYAPKERAGLPSRPGPCLARRARPGSSGRPPRGTNRDDDRFSRNNTSAPARSLTPPFVAQHSPALAPPHPTESPKRSSRERRQDPGSDRPRLESSDRIYRTGAGAGASHTVAAEPNRQLCGIELRSRACIAARGGDRSSSSSKRPIGRQSRTVTVRPSTSVTSASPWSRYRGRIRFVNITWSPTHSSAIALAERTV